MGSEWVGTPLSPTPLAAPLHPSSPPLTLSTSHPLHLSPRLSSSSPPLLLLLPASPLPDDRRLPDMHLALYYDVVVFDQATKIAYPIAWVPVGEQVGTGGSGAGGGGRGRGGGDLADGRRVCLAVLSVLAVRGGSEGTTYPTMTVATCHLPNQVQPLTNNHQPPPVCPQPPQEASDPAALRSAYEAGQSRLAALTAKLAAGPVAGAGRGAAAWGRGGRGAGGGRRFNLSTCGRPGRALTLVWWEVELKQCLWG